MVKLTEHELRLIAKNRGIKSHLNISRENLLSTLDKSEHITENLSKNGLNKIKKNTESFTERSRANRKNE